MKVKLLKNVIGSALTSKDVKAVVQAGSVIEVDDKTGKKLIERKLAEAVKEEKKADDKKADDKK